MHCLWCRNNLASKHLSQGLKAQADPKNGNLEFRLEEISTQACAQEVICVNFTGKLWRAWN